MIFVATNNVTCDVVMIHAGIQTAKVKADHVVAVHQSHQHNADRKGRVRAAQYHLGRLTLDMKDVG